MLVADVNNIEDVVKKVEAFGWHVVRINGHDYNVLKKTFNDLKKITDKPKMIIAAVSYTHLTLPTSDLV